MSEYREDDQSIGYCPLCFTRVSGLTTDARGFCPDGHGWVWVEWSCPRELDSEEDEDEALA